MFYKYFINELAFVIPKLDVTVTEWNLARNKKAALLEISVPLQGILCNSYCDRENFLICGVYISKQRNTFFADNAR